MRIIKLMADYHCFPLWEGSPGEVGNIDPKTLPISEELMNELLEWSAIYDSTLNMENPVSSGFKTQVEEAEFKNVGCDLGRRLQRELNGDYLVQLKI